MSEERRFAGMALTCHFWKVAFVTTPTPRQWQLLAYLLLALVAVGCALVFLAPLT